MPEEDEEIRLRSVALQNAQSILAARQRAEEALVRAKEELEEKTRQLAHSLAMMRATLEATTDGIVVTDGEGRITGFNQRYLEMWGLERELLEGGIHADVLEVCGREFADAAAFVGGVDEIYRTSPPESHDVLEMKDGRIFERSSRIQWVAGRNVGRVWSFRDVTKRRRAEEALHEETRVLELLNRAGMSVASQLDLKSLVQLVTDAGRELSGAEFGAFFYNSKDENGEALVLYTLSGAPAEAFEKLGHPRPTGLFGPTFRGADPIRCEDVLKDPRYGQMAPYFGMPPGHLPVRSYLAASVISRTGEVIGGLFFGHARPGVFTERAERVISGLAAQSAVAIDNAQLYEEAQRAAEERERLLEAERAARSEAERVSMMKDEFLATLSHELRTPLNAILGWSQLLGAREWDDEELREGIAVVERNARVQTQLIEDLLDMSRIISGKVRLDVQRVDLAEVVKAAVASVRHSAEAKGIRLEMVLDPLAGLVRGDPGRLQQCLWNLLSNAIKFTPKGGRVNVALERVNSHVEVTVEDNGKGISAAFLPHVFERFRQADASTTRLESGLGLGLSIVKHLIELHGGKVSAESPGVGKGAKFCMELPLMVVHGGERDGARVHPRAAAARVEESEDVSLSGLTVLVVDDEPDARHLIRRVLEKTGARVLLAGSAEEGMRTLLEERPDVLLSDIGMPGEDGYGFIRRIRRMGPEAGGRTPAAALTAFARAEDRTRALLAGYQSHVAKPVEPAELTAVVASLASR